MRVNEILTHHLLQKPINKFVPEDWYIVEAGPGGGIELDICNSKTKEATWFIPEGMTAEEILAIPDAKKYWSTIEEVKEYMEEKAIEKKESNGRDLIDELRENYEFWRKTKDE